MRWPWHRQPVPDVQAQAALVDADAKLSAQRRLQPEFDRVAGQLQERRHRNRFAELIEDALLRRHA